MFQWLTTGCGFSPGSSASSTKKAYPHDITEILLKVTLNTINQIINHYHYMWALQLSSYFPDPYGISKKGMKLSKWKPESVNLIRTYNTITKPKRTKGQTTIYKTPHRKLQIEQQEVFQPTLYLIIYRKSIKYMRLMLKYA